MKLADGIFSIHTDVTLKTAKKPDLIIIPAISGNLEHAIKLNNDFLSWIVLQYKNGAEVASLCLGAFILASTGLLNGKNCSTHWLFANEFKSMFAEVNLVDNKIVTEQNGLYTSGGANSYWNLLLHLVQKNLPTVNLPFSHLNFLFWILTGRVNHLSQCLLGKRSMMMTK